MTEWKRPAQQEDDYWGDEDPGATEELRRGIKLERLPPLDKARFDLANRVLFGFGLLLVLSGTAFYFDDENLQAGKIIYEHAVNVLSPIVTMILGYYFGSQRSK